MSLSLTVKVIGYARKVSISPNYTENLWIEGKEIIQELEDAESLGTDVFFKEKQLMYILVKQVEEYMQAIKETDEKIAQ